MVDKEKNQLIAMQIIEQRRMHNDKLLLDAISLKQRNNEFDLQISAQKEITQMNNESARDLEVIRGQNALSQIFSNSMGKIIEQNNLSLSNVALKLIDFSLSEISAQNQHERLKDIEEYKARLAVLIRKFDEIPKDHPHYDEIQTRLEYELKKQLAIEVENHKHNLRMSEKNAISEDDVRKILQDRLSYRPDDDY